MNKLNKFWKTTKEIWNSNTTIGTMWLMFLLGLVFGLLIRSCK